jgi:RNA polymerase sigma factor (sigma-70 family)
MCALEADILRPPYRPNVTGVPPRLLGDERLAREVARGSAAAFAALFHRYHQPLYRYCRSLTGSDHDAQDALQSTFTRALIALREDRRAAPMRPWLYRIAHNESVTIIRSRAATAPPVAAPVAPAVVDRFEEHERLAALVADLRELPERQRGALLMRELSGLSHDEIADALQVSTGAVKQSILEARRSLQEFAQGRAMRCEEIERIVSDEDGRSLRSRRVRSHLRDCAACGAFARAIPRRRSDLLVLAPALTPAGAAGILAHLTGAGSGSGGGGLGVMTGAAAKGAGATISIKAAAAGVAVVTTAAVGAVVVARHPLPSPRAPTAMAGGATAPQAARAGSGPERTGLEQPGRPSGRSGATSVAHRAAPRHRSIPARRGDRPARPRVRVVRGGSTPGGGPFLASIVGPPVPSAPASLAPGTPSSAGPTASAGSTLGAGAAPTPAGATAIAGANTGLPPPADRRRVGTGGARSGESGSGGASSGGSHSGGSSSGAAHPGGSGAAHSGGSGAGHSGGSSPGGVRSGGARSDGAPTVSSDHHGGAPMADTGGAATRATPKRATPKKTTASEKSTSTAATTTTATTATTTATTATATTPDSTTTPTTTSTDTTAAPAPTTTSTTPSTTVTQGTSGSTSTSSSPPTAQSSAPTSPGRSRGDSGNGRSSS